MSNFHDPATGITHPDLHELQRQFPGVVFAYWTREEFTSEDELGRELPVEEDLWLDICNQWAEQVYDSLSYGDVKYEFLRYLQERRAEREVSE